MPTNSIRWHKTNICHGHPLVLRAPGQLGYCCSSSQLCCCQQSPPATMPMPSLYKRIAHAHKWKNGYRGFMISPQYTHLRTTDVLLYWLLPIGRTSLCLVVNVLSVLNTSLQGSCIFNKFINIYSNMIRIICPTPLAWPCSGYFWAMFSPYGVLYLEWVSRILTSAVEG